MPEATADAVVGAVEAVVSAHGGADTTLVAAFLDLPVARAAEALDLSVDLGLLNQNGNAFNVASPLARLLVTPVLAQRAAILRVALEGYEPFRLFRTRLWVNREAVNVAAQQVKGVLGIAAHRDVIKGTLVSLGTYCQCLRTVGGDQYEVHFDFDDEIVRGLSGAVAELSESELRVRDWLGEGVRTYVDPADVLGPLAIAYLKVSQGDARGAVVNAGNAVESYLAQLGHDMGVATETAHGLGAKVHALDQANRLPKKIVAVGRYLGNVRNAADHGVDPDIGAAWIIRNGTGEDFLRVSIAFIEVSYAHWKGDQHQI